MQPQKPGCPDRRKLMLKILTTIDDIMYYPVLIIVMAAAGLYFHSGLALCSLDCWGNPAG